MTTMETFFETMKETAKYAVVAASLTSMLVTGMPGLAQAGQPELLGKATNEIVRMEANVVANWAAAKPGMGINDLSAVQTKLNDMFMKFQYAHHNVRGDRGEAEVSKALGKDWVPAEQTDLSSVKEFIEYAKSETGVDYSSVQTNFEAQIGLMSKMEKTLDQLSTAYNVRKPVKSEGWTPKYDNDALVAGLNARYEGLFTASRELRSSPEVSYLYMNFGNAHAQAKKFDNPALEEAAKADMTLARSAGTIETAIIRLAEFGEGYRPTFDAPQKVPMDQVKQAIEQVQASGTDYAELAKNLQDRHDIISRMETNFEAVVKDFHSKDNESLSKHLSLVELDILQANDKMQDGTLNAIRPEPEQTAKHYSHTSSYRSSGGGSHRSSNGFSATRVGIAKKAFGL